MSQRDRQIRFDRAAKLRAPVRYENGFVRVDGLLARSGILEYRNPDGSLRREWRPDEENFRADFLEQFAGAPVTDDHPDTFVNSDNFSQLSKGSVAGPGQREGRWIAGSLLIKDKALIEKLKGKNAISLGYSMRYEETPGVTPEGERYDGIQRDLKINHVAIVDLGRAGPEARLRLDSADVCDAEEMPEPAPTQAETETLSAEESAQPKDEKSMKRKIKINGVEVEVDANVADAFEQLSARADALQAMIKTHQDNAEAAKAAFAGAVRARVELEKTASEVLGSEYRADAGDVDLRKAVIAKLAPSLNLTGRNDDAIKTAFETVLALQSTKPHESLASARADATNANTAPKLSRVEEAMKANAEATYNAWKTAGVKQ